MWGSLWLWQNVKSCQRKGGCGEERRDEMSERNEEKELWISQSVTRWPLTLRVVLLSLFFGWRYIVYWPFLRDWTLRGNHSHQPNQGMWIQAEAAEQFAFRKPEGSDLHSLGPRGLQEHRGQYLASPQLNYALNDQDLEFAYVTLSHRTTPSLPFCPKTNAFSQ